MAQVYRLFHFSIGVEHLTPVQDVQKWHSQILLATIDPFFLQRFSKAVRSQDGMMSRALVYADVNTNRPSSYSDYENLSIQWG